MKNRVLIGVQPLPGFDPMPTQMLLEGVLSRTYHPTGCSTRWCAGPTSPTRAATSRPTCAARNPSSACPGDALALVADASLRTIEQHGNDAVFSSSYGGWSHAGVLRPQVLQGRLFGLIGGHSVTTGDYSGGASQISLPHIIGDMEVYSPQTAREVIRDNTEVFRLVGCDPWKNNRIEYTVADHQMYSRWEAIRDAGVKFVSINPQRTTTDEAMRAEWGEDHPQHRHRAVPRDVLVRSHQQRTTRPTSTNTPSASTASCPICSAGRRRHASQDSGMGREITGIPAAKIVEMAELFASKRTQFAGAWSLQRAHHGEMSHWAIIAFAAMTGKIGKGRGRGFSWHYGGGGMPVSGKRGAVGIPQGRNPGKGAARPPASRRCCSTPARPTPATARIHLPRRAHDLQRRQQLPSPAEHQRAHRRDGEEGGTR